MRDRSGVRTYTAAPTPTSCPRQPTRNTGSGSDRSATDPARTGSGSGRTGTGELAGLGALTTTAGIGVPGRPLAERLSALPVLLVLVDAAAAVAASLLAGLGPGRATLTVAVLVACRALAGLYRKRLQLSFVAELPRAAAATAVAFAVLLLAGHHGADDIAQVEQAVAWFVGLVVLPRAAVFEAGRQARRRWGRCERAVIVGVTGVGVDLADKMLTHPEFGLRPVGFVDREPSGPGHPSVPHLGDDVVRAVRETRAGCVVVAFAEASDSDLVDLAITAHRLKVSLLIVPRFFELYHDVASVERLRSYPLVRLALTPTARPTWWIKLALDKILAGLALLLLAPLLLAVGVAVVAESGFPVLFRQERVGLDGRLFELMKFRSMRPATDAESRTRWNIAGDPRVGPVGRFLRRTSLDELPQLWNVLRGDMSLVGPRPERPGFVRQFSAEHTRYWARHRVPTGLTGLAQVNGLRGDTSIADRARYDNYYIANWSLWLDLRIVLMTTRELLRRGQH
ncbi:sugar transferase [Pseudonocardia phyllosphaerae]|uniref:sugar transferase n=1 Tax=Pseudonocardia phyllosphaerae TaxID=3390502 RepID=UPI003979E828